MNIFVHHQSWIFPPQMEIYLKYRKKGADHETYLTTAMNGRTDTEECSAFLFIIGPKNREIFNTMTIVEEDRKKVFREKRHTFHGVIKGETITHGPVCYWLKNHIQEL